MLDFVTMQMCKSIDGPLSTTVGGYSQWNLFSERDWPGCTCDAHRFSRASINFGGRKVKPTCKHIRQAQKEVCAWHEQTGESQAKSGVCPRCGGSAVSVRVGV